MGGLPPQGGGSGFNITRITFVEINILSSTL